MAKLFIVIMILYFYCTRLASSTMASLLAHTLDFWSDMQPTQLPFPGTGLALTLDPHGYMFQELAALIVYGAVGFINRARDPPPPIYAYQFPMRRQRRALRRAARRARAHPGSTTPKALGLAHLSSEDPPVFSARTYSRLTPVSQDGSSAADDDGSDEYHAPMAALPGVPRKGQGMRLQSYGDYGASDGSSASVSECRSNESHGSLGYSDDGSELDFGDLDTDGSSLLTSPLGGLESPSVFLNIGDGHRRTANMWT